MNLRNKIEQRRCAVCRQFFNVKTDNFGGKAKTCGKLSCKWEWKRDKQRLTRLYG